MISGTRVYNLYRDKINLPRVDIAVQVMLRFKTKPIGVGRSGIATIHTNVNELFDPGYCEQLQTALSASNLSLEAAMKSVRNSLPRNKSYEIGIFWRDDRGDLFIVESCDGKLINQLKSYEK